METENSKTAKFLKRVLNWQDWSDWERTTGLSKYIGATVLSVLRLKPRTQKEEESFEDAVVRYELNDPILLKKQKTLFRLSVMMLLIAVGLCIYAFFHLSKGHYLSFYMSLSLMSVAAALSFRYHFWSFQIKQRKLGCTLKEWFSRGLMGMKE